MNSILMKLVQLNSILELNVVWDMGDAITTTRACAVTHETPYPLIFSEENTS